MTWRYKISINLCDVTFSLSVTSFSLLSYLYDVTSCGSCLHDVTSCVSGFMLVTFGYAVLVYLKEAMAKDGLIGGSSQEYKLEINPGDSFGLNPVAGQACVHPVLDLWHPELRQYFKEKGPLQCADDENWVYVHNGTFRISERARQKHGEIHCEYTPQLRGEYTL